MARPRTQLQAKLEEILGNSRVYYQPPAGHTLEYPCIVYQRDYSLTAHADNTPYAVDKRYLVTVITHDPDSPIPDKVEWLPQASFQRFFTRDQLNHFVYTIFF